MADFTSDLQNFTPPSPSFPLLDVVVDPNMESINQSILLDSCNFQSFIPFSNENVFNLHQAPDFPGNLADSFPGIFNHQNDDHHNVLSVASQPVTPGSATQFNIEIRKRKALMDVSESSSMNSSPQVSENEMKRVNVSRRRKRSKSDDEDGKQKEVVHVRARRGQATDSHSLAERVRRGKINERLRCLQDIVPGCYKTMGMAVMLDEIINYVQSLQNQVEFLSMKLTAASTFYNFNAEADAIDAIQRAKAEEAKEMGRMMKEGYGGVANGFHSTTWTL